MHEIGLIVLHHILDETTEAQRKQFASRHTITQRRSQNLNLDMLCPRISLLSFHCLNCYSQRSGSAFILQLRPVPYLTL